MEKGTFRYPANRFGGYLPNRISEPSDTRFSSDVVIHGFNDYAMPSFIGYPNPGFTIEADT